MADAEERSHKPIWLRSADARVWDHVRVHLQVLEDQRLGVYELAVYMGLVAHAETSSGRCYPSQETLASYARCSWSSVHRALKKLEATGYIKVVRRRGKAHFYKVEPMPPPLDAPPEVPPSDRQGSLFHTPVPVTGVEEAQTPVTDANHSRLSQVTPVPHANEREPRTRGSSSSPVARRAAVEEEEEEPFGQVWALYAKAALERRLASSMPTPVGDATAWRRAAAARARQEHAERVAQLFAEYEDMTDAIAARVISGDTGGLRYLRRREAVE